MKNLDDNSEESRQKLSLLTSPLSRYSVPRWLVFLLGLVGVVYILNPTLGIFELIPDNLPIIGNLDEGVAFLLIWASVLELFEGGKRQSEASSGPQDEQQL